MSTDAPVTSAQAMSRPRTGVETRPTRRLWTMDRPRGRLWTALITLLCWPMFAQAVTMTVCFTPGMDCAHAIIGAIVNARQTVLVQMYTFTAAPIAQALAEAKARGVTVQVILDQSQATDRYSVATYLVHHGIEVRIDRQHAIAHNKVLIVDGQTVVTGSFNYTRAAQSSNAENVLTIEDHGLARLYTQYWQDHAAHSPIYTGPGGDWMKK